MPDNQVNWWDSIAFPLHAALDEATDLPASTSVEDRWKLVMERCPWLVDRVCTVPATVQLGVDDGWTPLKSTNLDAFRVVAKMEARADGTVYPWAYQIEVRFKNGTIYSYNGVSKEDVDGLSTAESPGGYFSTWIKGKYPSEKVEG